ncbi:holothin acyltransferase-like [Glandiceps talaboti]
MNYELIVRKHLCTWFSTSTAAMASSFRIRHASIEDMRTIGDLIADEGWTFPVERLEILYKIDPNGFYVAENIDNKEVMGTAYVMNYSENLAWLGLTVTKKYYRKQGVQKELFKRCIEHAGERNIGLDAAGLHRSDVFIKMGFMCIDFKLRIYRGNVDHIKYAPGNLLGNIKVVKVDEVPFANLVSYDSTICKFNRPQFLQFWVNGKDVFTFVAIDNNGSDQIFGYGIVFPVRPLVDDRKYFALGPFYAENPDIAKALLSSLIRSLPLGSTVQLHVPQINTSAVDIFREYGFDEILELTRHYTKYTIKLPYDKVYCCGELLEIIAPRQVSESFKVGHLLSLLSCSLQIIMFP